VGRAPGRCPSCAASDELVAVFAGTLGRRSGAKGSSFFWPVGTGASTVTTLEETGIYVHRELVSELRKLTDNGRIAREGRRWVLLGTHPPEIRDTARTLATPG
jgi:hypothetical protein